MHRPRTMSCIVARPLGQAGSSMREIPHGATAIALILFATGCDPIVSVQGSFFPAWMLCIVIGIGLTVSVRYLFILTRLEPHLWPPALIYTSLGLLLTLVAWLVLFRI